MTPFVYIAGPYTIGNPLTNTQKAIEYAHTVANMGLYPVIPHLSHFWHTAFPRPYAFWLAYDLALLRYCHALLRLPGASPGADGEVRAARKRGMPVFHSTAALARWGASRWLWLEPLRRVVRRGMWILGVGR